MPVENIRRGKQFRRASSVATTSAAAKGTKSKAARTSGKGTGSGSAAQGASANGAGPAPGLGGPISRGVEADHLEAVRRPALEYRVGDPVEVRFYGDKKWYPGRVTDASQSGLLDVTLDDGTIEYQLELHMVRRPNRDRPAAAAYDAGMFIRGDYVDANLPRFDGSWGRARVAIDAKDGTYTVRLEDQSDESGVAGVCVCVCVCTVTVVVLMVGMMVVVSAVDVARCCLL